MSRFTEGGGVRYAQTMARTPVEREETSFGCKGAIWSWLVEEWQWPAAVVVVAGFLFALIPLIAGLAGFDLALLFAQLPVYMIHQWEEHSGDRFRAYMNRVIGGGREVLTPATTFWINALGVWGVNVSALYLAWTVKPSAGLVAGYLAIINGVLHLFPAVARREYNPGLVTALFLLLPAGGWCVARVGSDAGLIPHAIGLAAAVGVHLIVVAAVVGRLARLPKGEEPAPASGVNGR